MPKLFHALTKSLTGKLVIALSVLALCGSGLLWITAIKTEKKQLMTDALAFVQTFSELMKSSIRYDMLTAKTADIQWTIENIGRSESISGVRIYTGAGRIYSSSDKEEVGRIVEKSSFACAGCHPASLSPQEALTDKKRWTIYRDSDGHRILSFVEPIYNAPDCYTAACHVHSPDRKVLGVMLTDFSLAALDAEIKKQEIRISFYMLAFVVVIAGFLSVILWRFVLGPVRILSEGMKRVSAGDLSHKVEVPSTDEMGGLARVFNDMTDELSLARQRMQRWTQSLEEEVDRKTAEIQKTQDKLIQAEKLAALGRLSADIAHEIRNPLTALGGFGRRIRKLAETDDLKKYADVIVSETDRLENILKDILTFSRSARFSFEKQALTATVRDSVALFASICHEQSIRIEEHFNTDLPVLLEPDQIRQALNNLITNAIDAMPAGGVLAISTEKVMQHNTTYVAVLVDDTGPGIPADKLSLVLEPFYTTKKIGHGTGLGLPITRKIIEEHGGFIKAENREGGGLRVGLYFPYQSAADLAKMPCWEFMKCGRDKDNSMKCPAFPHYGRTCWAVAGTLCEGKVQGTFAQKYNDCTKCPFYKSVMDAAGQSSTRTSSSIG